MLNYARLYGSGVVHASNHLMQNGMKEKDAKAVASELFKITKGAESRYVRNHSFDSYIIVSMGKV